MQTQDGFQNLPALNSRYIGSFRVTELQRQRLLAALSIAKQMHMDGEGEMEDAVRAIALLRGGGHLDDTWSSIEAEDYEDYDRQVTAYYDGVAELCDVLTSEHPFAHLLATMGSC